MTQTEQHQTFEIPEQQTQTDEHAEHHTNDKKKRFNKKKYYDPDYFFDTDVTINPFSSVGLFTFLRTYARRIDETDVNSFIETWGQTVKRVVLACNDQLNVGFTHAEMVELFSMLYNLKGSVAGRFLWQMGTTTIEKAGLTSLMNCAATVIDSPIEPFTWAMNMQMMGAGVGYRLLPEDLKDIPIIKYANITRLDTNSADYILPDTREGWVKLLGKVLKAHFYSGKDFTYSCMLIRSKGAPIKGFGGTASGPDSLCEGMDKISALLNKREGCKLRTIDALDIMNLIGQVIVSGNIRRSAQIAIGDCNDTDFLRAKRWDLGNIPNHRAFSNNSVVCNDIEELLENDEFWNGYQGDGEPYGIINMNLSQSCGRIGETQYPDTTGVCYNPCFSGDMRVITADGRGSVSFKQLAEEGKDVPVYSLNEETGRVEIKWGRHTRITGVDMKLLRIHFSGVDKGEYVDVTPNHEVFLMDGRVVQAKDLVKGDSVPRFKKYLGKDGYVGIHTNIYDANKNRITEHRLVKEFLEPDKFYQDYETGVSNGCCSTGNVVVHHLDDNKSNNHLQIMTFSEHSTHHGIELVGDKNPMWGKTQSAETRNLIGQRAKERCANPEYIEMMKASFTDEGRAILSDKMTRQKYDWDVEYANEIEKQANLQGLRTERVSETLIRVIRVCENEKCKEEFKVVWSARERAYCSISCGNTKKEAIEARRMGIRKTYEEKSKGIFHKQVMIYKDLQEIKKGQIDEKVYKKEWENECRERKISFRFQTITPNKWICKNWKEFVERANNYNHRVERVEELQGLHKVYNITVDDNHTLCLLTSMNKDLIGMKGVFFRNCGEIFLSNMEFCCLSELYLPNINSKDELFTISKYLYRICKHSMTLPCADSEASNDIVHKNMRMGIGITGFCQSTQEQKEWLPECYEYLRCYDKLYSKRNKFPQSIKLTTTKPSGCSRGDMYIQTTEGLMRLDEFGDIHGSQWQNISLENIKAVADDESKHLVTKFYVNGYVDTKKIITIDGLELESSLNHKYRVITAQNEYVWKKSEYLKVGDKLAVKIGGHPSVTTNIPFIVRANTKNPLTINEDLAWLLGLLYRCGSIYNNQVYFHGVDEDETGWIMCALEKYFDIFHYFFFKTMSKLKIISENLTHWLNLNGINIDPLKATLAIPRQILQSNKDCATEFIKGFWKISDDGSPRTKKPIIFSDIQVYTYFLQQFLQLCRSVGFNVFISNANSLISLQFKKDLNSRKIIVGGNTFWLDPIVSTEHSKCLTYDIEVDTIHHYRLGGVISHNTLSLLAGVTSGVHPGFARYYIRRIRVSSESPLIPLAKAHGYFIEYMRNFDKTHDRNTMVIEFPYTLPEHTILASQCSAIQQLENAKWLQTHWSDNSVSITCYYHKKELPEIKQWLRENYNNSVKTVSFLLHSDHGFDQAPLEEITKERYDEMMRNTIPIQSVAGICYNKNDDEFVGEGECPGGVCPIK
jgi:intein/homing endonuclease